MTPTLCGQPIHSSRKAPKALLMGKQTANSMEWVAGNATHKTQQITRTLPHDSLAPTFAYMLRASPTSCKCGRQQTGRESTNERMAARCQKPRVRKSMEVPPCGTNCTAATIKLIRTTPDAKMMATFAYKLRAEAGPCENTSDRNASCRQHHTKKSTSNRNDATRPHDGNFRLSMAQGSHSAEQQNAA